MISGEAVEKKESTIELVFPRSKLILSERLDGSRNTNKLEKLSYCIKKED
jgi:hypothetical protein